MLKQCSLLLLMSVFFFACSKKPDTTATPNNTNNQNDSSKNNNNPADSNNTNNNHPAVDSFAFIINGVHDLTMEKTGQTTIPLAVALVKGTQEKVTLSVAGLPTGVTSSFDATSGTPDFASILSLTSADAKVGSYTVTIKGTSASNVVKSYDATLTIKAPSDCGSPFLGYHNYSRSSTPALSSQFGSKQGSIDVESNIDNNTNPNVLYLTDEYGTIFGDMRLVLNCADNTITIPQQTMGQRTFKGSGSFSTSPLRINLSYTETHDASIGGGTYQCNVAIIY